MDNLRLFDLLLKAESETEVEEALKKAGYLNDDSDQLAAVWRLRNESQPNQQPAVRRDCAHWLRS